ncbi:MAG: hypothetical protein R8L58_07340 [Mariprofundaceae bacterium]
MDVLQLLRLRKVLPDLQMVMRKMLLSEWRDMKRLFLLLCAVFFCQPALASDIKRFLQVKTWQCAFSADLHAVVKEKTGPAGMAYDPKRQFFQALGATGVKTKPAGGDTDEYRESRDESVKGHIRLHHVYDGGPDGIQIAGWNNGDAEVRLKHVFEGTEQNRSIIRDKTATYEGPATFSGDEYEPPFQIWVYSDQGTYSLEYHLSPVRALQVEHCRMKEGVEGDRKKLESATDADMPLGSFFSGMTKASCPTERKGEVDIDGGAFGGMVENVPLPASGLAFSGEGESQFADTKGVKMRWNCQPEE